MSVAAETRKNLISVLLLAFAVLVFLLLAFKVIDHNQAKWLDVAFAAFAAAFLPWPAV